MKFAVVVRTESGKLREYIVDATNERQARLRAAAQAKQIGFYGTILYTFLLDTGNVVQPPYEALAQ
jgi:hypothetical protein